MYKDIRELTTIDPDTADITEVQILANQLLTKANDDSFVATPRALQEALDGGDDDLRKFIKTGIHATWSTDLAIKISQAMTAGDTNVDVTAQEVLDTSSMDAHLAFLNDGLYAAHELDCATQATPTPSATTAHRSSTPTSTG